MHVGGVCQRLEFVVAGEALVQMSHAEAQSKAGDVCVSSNVWEMIQHDSWGHPTLDAFESLENGCHIEIAHLVVSMDSRPEHAPSDRRWLTWNQDRHPAIAHVR